MKDWNMLSRLGSPEAMEIQEIASSWSVTNGETEKISFYDKNSRRALPSCHWNIQTFNVIW